MIYYVHVGQITSFCIKCTYCIVLYLLLNCCAGVCQLEKHSPLATEEPAEGYRCVWESVGETGGECECMCVHIMNIT